jgi:drug/metabolite transporter (DMT)-like permease
VAAFLALTSALTFGTGDFLGGLAARRIAATTVVLWSHGVGLVLMLALAPIVGGTVRGSDLVAGMLAGAAGAAGVGLLYRGLAIGTMSVVAPITALLAAAVPVVAGLAEGDVLTLQIVAGIAAAALAIVLISLEGTTRPSLRDLPATLLALGAGLGFGFFFVGLAASGDDSGLWPLVAARTTSVTIFFLLTVFGFASRALPRGRIRLLTIGAGALDVAANVLFLLATREGQLSVVSVLSALYPASTVALAWLVLHERLRLVQQAGLALAVPATILIVA